MSGKLASIASALLAVSVLFSGCGLTQWAENGMRVGPNYVQPATVVADDWLDSDNERVLPQPPSHLDWWSSLNDPIVNDLVSMALQQNLTLRQAALRVMQARAARNITAGNLLPQSQFAFGDYFHIQNSLSTAIPPPLRTFDQWETGFNASWELDLWGKLRRAVESSDAQLNAAVADYDAVVVTLIADVVTAYVEVRTFEERLSYAQQNVKTQEDSLKLSTKRFDEGKIGQVGVLLAESNLRNTEATIPPLQAGLRQATNRLCTLLSIPPSDLSGVLGKDLGIPDVSSNIALGIPADLLRRRPDVRSLEHQVAAQTAQIGVAISELYPSIAINGEIFQASAEFDDLFQSTSTAGSVGPSFRWNVLNYGRILNNVRLQDALLMELIAAYQNQVIVANQEVEDAVVAFLKSQQEVDSLAKATKALDESLQLLLIQFEEGSIDFSPIFLLQGSLRAAQDNLAAAQGQVLLNLIAVYRALGGGWEIRCPQYQYEIIPTDGTTVDFNVPENSQLDDSSFEPEVDGEKSTIPETGSEIPDNSLRRNSDASLNGMPSDIGAVPDSNLDE